MLGNEIKIKEVEVLSDNWYVLRKITYDFKKNNGEWETVSREAYDRGNGAVILLYDTNKKTVILTRQFRMPTFLNGNKSGMLIEACAGLLDQNNPEDCIRRETEEETGFKIKKINRVFEAYMSPGSVTELLYFFIAEYSKEMKVSEGGGLEEDQEEIEVLELPYVKALEMVNTGEIKDGKTILLLQYLRLNNLI